MNDNDDAAPLFAAARLTGRTALLEPEAKAILGRAGLVVPRGAVVRGSTFLGPEVELLRFPLAAKIVSVDALHKSDIGGVLLHIDSHQALIDALESLEAIVQRRGLHAEGYLIEEMAALGQEVVIGGTMDPRFGPVLMLGLGGVFVEIFRDVAFRVCPIDFSDAADMIDELRSAPLLRGARGRAKADETALVSAMLAIGGEAGLLVKYQNDIAELDINPLLVSPSGAVACDARIVLQAK